MSTTTLDRPSSIDTTARTTGLVAIVAVAVMVSAAIIWTTTGTDLDTAVTDGTVAEYVAVAASDPVGIVAHLSGWVVGVSLLAAAAMMMARMTVGRRTISILAETIVLISAAVALAAFTVWFALVSAADRLTDESLMEVLGFIASRGDWIGTVGIVGITPFLLSRAGRDEWVPPWLVRVGYGALATGALATVALFTGDLATLGFPVVLAGLVWYGGAGITLMRSSRTN